MKTVTVAVALVVSLVCGTAHAEVEAAFQPPFLPVSLAIDSNGKVSLRGEASVAIPIGVFTLGAALPLRQQADYTYVVVRNRRTKQDSVFKIHTVGTRLNVHAQGKTTVTIEKHFVVVDVTDGNIERIRFINPSGSSALKAGSVWRIAFNQDGSLLASGSDDAMVGLWKIDTGELVTMAGHDRRIENLFFRSDDRLVSTEEEGFNPRVWDTRTGACVSKRLHRREAVALQRQPPRLRTTP